MLSELQCRKAKPKGSPYKLADAGGLHLFVSTTGHRSWRLKYRFGGKERRLTFGPYPEVTLVEARERRDAARRLLRDHIDPGVEAKRRALVGAADAENSFEKIARAWYAKQISRWKPVHAADVIHSLERDIFPHLGNMPITAIDAPSVLATLRKVEERGAVETAHRLRQRMSSVFTYAIAAGVGTVDPAASLGKALAPVAPKRKRPALVALPAVRNVMEIIDHAPASPITKLASRLLALTAQRPGMVRMVRWSEIVGVDWESEEASPEATWVIPALKMKLEISLRQNEAFDHPVPLSAGAIDVLRAVRRLSGDGVYVFPSGRSADAPMSENALGYLYNRFGLKDKHVPHGWRSSFSTIMNERVEREGRPLDRLIIDLMLAHLPRGMSTSEWAYNRATYMDRRREIAQIWADLLMSAAGPASSLLKGPRRRKLH